MRRNECRKFSPNPGREPGRITSRQRRNPFARIVSGATCLALLAAACNNGSGPEPVAVGNVEIELDFVVGNLPLERGVFQYSNAAGNNYQIDKLIFCLSNFRVQGPDGAMDFDLAQFIDAFDPDTHHITLQDIPATHYHNVLFTFGLSAEDNVSGAYDSQPQLSGEMAWPELWGGGYHYMKLEGKYGADEANTDNFATHTGRYRDPQSGQSFHHDFRVTGTPHFNVIEGETKSFKVTMDINQWYEGPVVIDLSAHDALNGIMTNTDEQNKLQSNGASVFEVEVLDEHDHGGGG